MGPRRDPVPRARSAGHWLAGILVLGILGAGVVSAAVLLWENLDIRQLAPTLAEDPGPLPQPELPLAAAAEGRGFQAVVFASPANATFFPDSAYHPRSVAQWRDLVEALGGSVRMARTAEELEGVAPDELLLVPDAPCLSRAEVASLERHLDAGGGLVSNWAVGARDERCEWRGWQAVAALTAARDVRELGSREALYLAVPSGTVLSAGLDPGARIELIPEPSLALLRPGARVYWSDWALNPSPDESGGGADVAATSVRLDDGGRSVWFGFRLTQGATRQDSVRLARLVENGVRWAAGIPTGSVSPWPDGKRAAMVIAQDVEAEYRNALALAELLRERGVPGTFYPVTQLVLEEGELAEALSAAGEVGSQTSDHQPVAGLPLDEQLVRLRRSWVEVRGWTGTPPAGLRPPEESFDQNTLRAWGEVGGRYVLAVNQARSGSPEIHFAGDGTIVLLPRLLKDDYNVFVQDGAVRSDRLTEAWLEGLRKLRAMGGVAVVASHTQILGSSRRLDAVRAVLDAATADGDWWVADAASVADWWTRRAGLQVGLLAGQPGTADTTARPLPSAWVEAPEGSAVAGVWLDLTIPSGEPVAPLVDGAPAAYVETEWGVRVPVGDLAPGQRRLVTLRRPTP